MRAVATVCTLVVSVLAFLVGGCGDDDLSLAEYARRAEGHITAMNERIDDLGAEWTSRAPTVAGARRYWEGRIEARHGFIEALRALDPPGEAEELHEVVLDLMARFTAAEEGLAAEVTAMDDITDHWGWWETPEGQAALGLNVEAVALCDAAQARFDATEQGESLADVPWIPSEMTEVIEVAFDCSM